MIINLKVVSPPGPGRLISLLEELVLVQGMAGPQQPVEHINRPCSINISKLANRFHHNS